MFIGRIASCAAGFRPRRPGTFALPLVVARRMTGMADSARDDADLGGTTEDLNDKNATLAPAPHNNLSTGDKTTGIAVEGKQDSSANAFALPHQQELQELQELQEPAISPSTPSKDAASTGDPHYYAQMELLSAPTFDSKNAAAEAGRVEEVETTPLFSQAVKVAAANSKTLGRPINFPQYGLIGGLLAGPYHSSDPRLFINTNAPWSAFICGSQGSGKSHTLSCILENSLLSRPALGPLPKPLSGLVFHYDVFNSFPRSQVCEAAHLSSSGMPVKVLVSPSNPHRMKEVYMNLPGEKNLQVEPLMFNERHLNVSRVLTLMGAGDSASPTPLYMEVVRKILREVATSTEDRRLDYEKFKTHITKGELTAAQRAPLKLRLDLLESFLDKSEAERPGIWDFQPGTLTIVDLSCPFVDEKTACTMFDVCLSVFLERNPNVGKIVALDEAHKYMNQSSSATRFTQSLLNVIRLQRHLATRVVVATQEPTISPKILDLCSMAIVHRFTSPQWLEAISDHLAGAAALTRDLETQRQKVMFERIVNLSVGEALLFSPSAITSTTETSDGSYDGEKIPLLEKLGPRYLKMRVRKRLTTDGGRSIMAVEKNTN